MGVGSKAGVAVRRMRAIAVSGRTAYLGAADGLNLGDDAMFEATLLHAPSVWRPVSICPDAREQNLRRVHLSGPSVFRRLILGGGTLINPHWLPIVNRYLRSGTAIASFGTGVGSSGFAMPEDVALEGWSDALKQFRSVTVRGPISQQRLLELGIGSTVIGDPALSLVEDHCECGTRPDKAWINVAVSDLDTADASTPRALIDAFAVLTAQLRRRGLTPHGVAMHDSDVEPTRAALIGGGVASAHVARPRSGREYLDLVAGSSVVVCVRLHAAVLAHCAGVSAVPLAYRSKTRDYLTAMGRPDLAIQGSMPIAGELIDALDAVLAHPHGQEMHQAAVVYRNAQRQHFPVMLSELGVRLPSREGRSHV